TNDSSFGSGGVVDLKTQTGANYLQIYNVNIRNDGKLLATGTAGVPNDPQGQGFAAILMNSNGTLDRSFGNNGVTEVHFSNFDTAIASAFDPSGKIVLFGNDDNPAPNVARL